MNPGVVRQAVGICCAAGALLVLGWCAESTLPADEPLDADNFNQVLIFHSGRTVKGKISRSPNGYVVEHGAGRLVVPFEETRVIGKSLPDAYRRLKESFVELTANTHYELAKWCWTHQLREEARSELVMALDRDAGHEAARDLLERIDEQLAAGRKKSPAKPPEPRIVGGFEVPEVESLAGLSRETAAQYSSKIQPLLMNKCANASCHGPQSSSDFHLEPIRGTGPGHRMYSERNLARVLNELDLARPSDSPLLRAGDSNHGGLNRAIFYGPAGEKQRKTLSDWVRAVAKEQQLAQKQQERRPSVTKKSSPARSSAALDQALIEPESDTPPRMASITKASSPAEDQDDTQVDAFDPEVFNRKYHGRTEEKPATRRPNLPERSAPKEPSP